MCCYVLQRVEMCSSVCCNLLQCVIVCCSVLQCVAVCCSALQCVAVRCSVYFRYKNTCHKSALYGVALVSRIDTSIGLFCKRDL